MKFLDNSLVPEIKEIISFMSFIDVDVVDEQRSSLTSVPGFVTIEMYAKKDRCCPFSISIRSTEEGYKVALLFNNTGPIIEDLIKGEEDLSYFKEDIFSILSNNINEIHYLCREKIVKSRYSYYLDINDRQEEIHYTGGKMSLGCLFTEKQKIETRYQPWIK